MTLSELDAKYRAYRDKYTPWPSDLPTRIQAVLERNELDKIDLTFATKRYQVRHIKARIRANEQFLAEHT